MQFPNWYVGGFDDMENTLICLLDNYCSTVQPAPRIVGWVPEDFRAHLPMIVVGRVPGAIDEDPQFDTGVVQVWCVADTRRDAWALAEFVRTILIAFRKGVMVDVGAYRSDIQSIERAEGPQLSMEDERLDERTVPLSFIVKTRRRASLPNYERVLKTL
jgi:hypothetical protein